ncbi:hemin ABC transporter substrate-binding protein [Vespertiliibacter pulmonis]|nr:hemin ABC transporter substrate-binding protein [Vespertiliibacter pulmonis]
MFKYLSTCLLFTSGSLMAQERILSIGGDVTEIIYALNAEKDLIGRDSTSIIPEQAKKLPDVGYMRNLNTEGILALKPTRIIATQAAQPTVVLEQVKAAGVNVDHVPLQYTVESVVEKIKTVGKLVGKEQQAVTLADKFVNEINAIDNSPKDVKVLFILSRSGTSQMVAGSNTAPDTAIKLVGAKNAMSSSVRYVPISQEGIIAANPDLIVISSLSIKDLGSIDKLWELPGIAYTNAGKKKQAVVVDDIAFLAFGLTIPAELQKMRQAVEKASQL